MFGYIDNIVDNSMINNINNFKIVWNNNIIWITNYIKILKYSKETILLKVKGDILKIEGKDIDIVMLQKKEIVLKGAFYLIGLESPMRRENNA